MAQRARCFGDDGRPVPFDRPLPLDAPELNTGAHELTPFLTSDWPAGGAELYFARSRGVFADIWVATWRVEER